jgi:hypothetical protein
VYIDDDLCGTIEPGTSNGKWYQVECSEPLFGKKVRLVTT